MAATRPYFSTLLGLGLAESIIICSHNEDVQARFPHRWYVRKQGATATVERQADEDDENTP